MEIEVEGVGPVRPMTDEQIKRLHHHRKDGLVYMLACMSGRTVRQFKKLTVEQRRAVHRAYLKLTSPDNFKLYCDAKQASPPRFQAGIHRSDAEKIEIGRKLLGIKERLPHGLFGPRLEQLGIPARYAHMCMRMAREAAITAPSGVPQPLPEARQHGPSR